MCGIGALFAFPKGLLVNNSEQLTTSLQQAFLNNNNNNNNNNTNTSSNNQQQENLIKLHYLLQYGNISSTTTIDNNNNNGNNNEELKKNNDDDEDTERNESFQEKINKILSIPLMKQKPKQQSTNNNHNDNHSHNNENNNVENSHNCSHNNENNVETDNNLLSKIKSIETVISPRGPDETHHFILNENFNENVQEDNCATIHSDYNVCLIASLLALRGERPYPQPLQINNEHYLIWNGEIFGNEEYFSDCVLGHENDGMCLLKQLFNCKTEIEVLTVLSNIEGPFSFVYLNKKDNYLLFGRDILGRRSLLYSLNENCTEIVISSVACHLTNFYEWNSIGVNGIFKIQLSNNNNDISDISDISDNRSNSSSIGCKIELLEWDMIYKEINRKPLIADRTCIEPLSSSLLLNSDNNKENNNEGKEEEDLENYEKLVDQFIEALSNGVRKRVTNIFDRYSNDDDDNNNSSTLSSTHKEEEAQLKKEENNLKHAKVCILFSGGIDSVILTALTHLNISSQEEPIDLLNVSFGNNKNQQEASADRKQAIESYQELKTLYPTRNFRLILINVNPNELQEERTIIEKLIYPQHTVIDFNIGSALWFASRGKEDNKEDNNERIIEYTSKARVILCGIGSDEQLGGYRRHFKKFKYFGWKGLNEEMDMDIKRLWIRNLGRDDRVISYHGRESRNPFLDEPFINFVRTLPLWYLASFNHVNANSDKQDKKEDNGMKTTLPGDKKILRRAAQKLGLTRSCLYVKRAMQFGSNIAKISFKKQHANDTIDIVL
ncbi:hypothetical protein ABK040_004930 [Willaertia magna]